MSALCNLPPWAILQENTLKMKALSTDGVLASQDTSGNVLWSAMLEIYAHAVCVNAQKKKKRHYEV